MRTAAFVIATVATAAALLAWKNYEPTQPHPSEGRPHFRHDNDARPRLGYVAADGRRIFCDGVVVPHGTKLIPSEDSCAGGEP